MKVHAFVAIAMAFGLALTGCDRSQPVAGGNATKEPPKTGESGGDYANFEVVKPESYSGDFNPGAMTVGLKAGNLAPDIVGTDLDGVDFKLSDYRGKVVMLDFWGDW